MMKKRFSVWILIVMMLALVLSSAAAETAGTVKSGEEIEWISATLTVMNQTKFDFVTMHISSSDSTSWGPDVLGDQAPLRDNEMITFNVPFMYHQGLLSWDLKAFDANGMYVEFKGIDLSRAADPLHITFDLTFNPVTKGFSASVK